MTGMRVERDVWSTNLLSIIFLTALVVEGVVEHLTELLIGLVSVAVVSCTNGE